MADMAIFQVQGPDSVMQSRASPGSSVGDNNDWILFLWFILNILCPCFRSATSHPVQNTQNHRSLTQNTTFGPIKGKKNRYLAPPRPCGGWLLRWLAASAAGRFGGWLLLKLPTLLAFGDFLDAPHQAGCFGGWPLRWLAASVAGLQRLATSVAGHFGGRLLVRSPCAGAVLVLCLCTCRRLLVPLVRALVPVCRWYVGIGHNGGLI